MVSILENGVVCKLHTTFSWTLRINLSDIIKCYLLEVTVMFLLRQSMWTINNSFFIDSTQYLWLHASQFKQMGASAQKLSVNIHDIYRYIYLIFCIFCLIWYIFFVCDIQRDILKIWSFYNTLEIYILY